MAAPYAKWTEQQYQTLLRQYRKRAPLKETARLIGKSVEAIQTKAKSKGLSLRSHRLKSGAFVASGGLQKSGQWNSRMLSERQDSALELPGLDACDKRGIY